MTTPLADIEQVRRRGLERLREHMRAAMDLQDLTGNALASATGWLDVLADSGIVDQDRVGSVRTTACRLEGVQAAVNALLDDVTAQYIAEVANDEVDMVQVWGNALGDGAGMPTGSIKIRSNAQCLEAFLLAAQRILAPAVEVDARWALVPIIDLGSMGHRTLTHLRTSNGQVWRREGQEYACWQVVMETT